MQALIDACDSGLDNSTPVRASGQMQDTASQTGIQHAAPGLPQASATPGTSSTTVGTGIPLTLPHLAQNNWRRRSSRQIPEYADLTFQAWFDEHMNDSGGPYPSHAQCQQWICTTGLSLRQIRSWFRNRRQRDQKFKKLKQSQGSSK